MVDKSRPVLKAICGFLVSFLCLINVAWTGVTIDEQTILNAEYLIATSESVERIRFRNGEYQRGSSVFEEGFLVAWLDDAKFADLNNDGFQDVVVIVVSNTGGSGGWISLSGLLGGGEKPVPIEPVFLGDRVVVREISIVHGSKGNAYVCLDMLVHGSKDASCCPTRKTKRCFTLSKEKGRWTFRERN